MEDRADEGSGRGKPYIGAGFAAVLPGFAAGAAVHYATGKLMGNSLSKTDFMADRVELVAARDQYREALLQEINDDGVTSITTARWDKIQQYEVQGSLTPTRSELHLLAEVDQLEFLADQRKHDGWQGQLAHAQDDPAKFATEFELVQTHDGLLQTMVAGHGQSSAG